MKQRMFVYGTLKRGFENAHYLEGQHFVGEARTKPCYRMVDCGGYPGMFEVGEGGLGIRGEVWEVNEAGRQQLDVLEDVAVGLYTVERVLLEAPFESAEVLAYFYAWPLEGKRDVGEEWRDDTAGRKAR